MMSESKYTIAFSILNKANVFVILRIFCVYQERILDFDKGRSYPLEIVLLISRQILISGVRVK